MEIFNTIQRFSFALLFVLFYTIIWNFSKEVQSLFLSCVQEAKHRSTVHYKNGWIVEKDILVTILERQASRLSKKTFISEQDLKQIEIEDLPVTKKTETVEDILAMLNELIGMEVVKKSVADLCQSILNNQKRKTLGLTAENPKIHLVLTGNPGTGKTTVARLISDILYDLKIKEKENGKTIGKLNFNGLTLTLLASDGVRIVNKPKNKQKIK